RRDHIRVCGVALRVDLNAEKFETIADARADRPGVLADAAGEDERIDSAERRPKRADRFRNRINVHVHGEAAGGFGLFAIEKQLHVGTLLRYAEESGSFAQDLFDLIRGKILVAG